MTSRNDRRRTRFQLEALEGRIALSGVGGLDDGPRHHALHNTAAVRGADDHLPRHHAGQRVTAAHDVGDDHLPKHGGKDDGAGHR